MVSFETATEAHSFVRDKVDAPVQERQEAIGEALSFHAFSQELDNGQFTNVYEVSFRAGAVSPVFKIHDLPSSAYDYASRHRETPIVLTGGFFFLADHYSRPPRQLALNLAVDRGKVYSLPIVDREAILSDGKLLAVESIQAMGVLSIEGTELSWAGSLTNHQADCQVFNAANSVITHEYSESTGHNRVLAEWSRFTPPITEDGLVDVGYVRRGDGTFMKVNLSTKGNLDIFSHDLVLRCHEKYVSARPSTMTVHTVGHKALDGSLQGALSVGPSLGVSDFEAHPINKDLSLGDSPPFSERPLARPVIYQTEDGIVHIRLFDGRPESQRFPGVTPSQAVALVREEGSEVWGCFLDCGQSTKLCVRNGNRVESLGNAHYLKWPNQAGDRFIWAPKIGRPIASMITLQ